MGDILEIIVTKPGSPNASAITKSKSSKIKSKKSRSSEKSLDELGKEFKFIITNSNQDQKFEDMPTRQCSGQGVHLNFNDLNAINENEANSNELDISDLLKSDGENQFTGYTGMDILSSKHQSSLENSGEKQYANSSNLMKINIDTDNSASPISDGKSVPNNMSEQINKAKSSKHLLDKGSSFKIPKRIQSITGLSSENNSDKSNRHLIFLKVQNNHRGR